jgi:hypothetical protein
MPETVTPPAAASLKPRRKPAANTALKRQVSEAIPGTSAQLHARRAQKQLKEMPGRIVREIPKEVLPQVLLSDAVAVRASPKNAVKDRIYN